jgi:hypothetical protein
LDEDNNITETLRYSVEVDGAGRYQFKILDQSGMRRAVPLRSGLGQGRRN